VWYIPDGIVNIFSMHELKKQYRITYNSWEGHYVVHTPKGEVNFYKYKQGLPYIELNGPAGRKAAVMLLQSMQQEHVANTGMEVMHVQTVHGNYEGHTKRDVLQAKEARRAQAMIGNPSKGDFKGMVSGNLIKTVPSQLPTSLMPTQSLVQTLQAFEGRQCDGCQHRWWQIMWQWFVWWWNKTKW
jgi:hypothetical protein